MVGRKKARTLIRDVFEQAKAKYKGKIKEKIYKENISSKSSEKENCAG